MTKVMSTVAFNVVIPEEKCGTGYLIDFDFSGKPGEVVYPKGYSSLLPDGDREGEGGEKIEKWHALGQLIFVVHHFVKPKAEHDDQFWIWFSTSKDYWTTLDDNPSNPKIHELKNLLTKLDEKNWTIEPRPKFKRCLKKSDTSGFRSE